MLTKEERAAIRAQVKYELHYFAGIGAADAYQEQKLLIKLAESVRGIPRLLDALDEAEARISELAGHLGACEDCHSAHEAKEDGIKFERNHYKSRAEALERAIRSRDDKARWACKHWPNCLVGCDCGDNWQFDEARFSGGDNV